MDEFFSETEEAGKKLLEYNSIAFSKSIDLFLDTIGMLTEDEQKRLLKKIKPEDADTLNSMKFCRLRYLEKQMIYPRNRIADILRK